jgi:hypothetical protein|eukprot:SAG31_NODE_2929_length_4899_cov_1.752292_5_plen_75_part_00
MWLQLDQILPSVRSFLGAKILLYDQRALLLDGLYLEAEQGGGQLDLSAVIEQMEEVMGVCAALFVVFQHTLCRN